LGPGLPFIRITNFYSVLQERPVFGPLFDRVLKLYADRDSGPFAPAAERENTSMGPVGYAMSDARALGLSLQNGDFRTLTQKDGPTLRPVEATPGEFRHELRTLLKRKDLSLIDSSRIHYQGMKEGVDYAATNALWLSNECNHRTRRAIKDVMTSDFYFNARRAHLIAGASAHCDQCDAGVEDTMAHMLWECTAYDATRAEYNFVADKTYEAWPPCFRYHGIVPEAFSEATKDIATLAGRVQRMHACIAQQRRALVRAANVEQLPWMRIANSPYARVESEVYGVDPEEAGQHGWKFSPAAWRATVKYAEALQWTGAGKMSFYELVIDFELHTKYDITSDAQGGRGATSSLSSKAAALKQYFMKTNAVASKLNYTLPFPEVLGEKVTTCGWAGATVLVGFGPRPKFLAAATPSVLLRLLPTGAQATTLRMPWGTNISVTYRVPLHEADADAAEPDAGVPALPAQHQQYGRCDPVHIPRDQPHGVVMTAGGNPIRRTCLGHNLAPCRVCRNEIIRSPQHRRRELIEHCCAAHHRTEANRATMPADICAKHRMTKCGTCRSMHRCCQELKHHVCAAHNLRTCDACLNLPGDIKFRRPGACCGKGHHDLLNKNISHQYSPHPSDDETESAPSGDGSVASDTEIT